MFIMVELRFFFRSYVDVYCSLLVELRYSSTIYVCINYLHSVAISLTNLDIIDGELLLLSRSSSIYIVIPLLSVPETIFSGVSVCYS